MSCLIPVRSVWVSAYISSHETRTPMQVVEFFGGELGILWKVVLVIPCRERRL
jgi:hypothetical protein